MSSDPPSQATGHEAPAAPGAGQDGPATPVADTPPPRLSVLIWPGLILAIVALLVLPSVVRAFDRFPDKPIQETTTSTGQEGSGESGTPIEVTTPTAGLPPPNTQTSGGAAQGTVIPQPTNILTALPTNVRREDLATTTAAPAATTLPPTNAVPAPTETVVPTTVPSATAAPTDTALPSAPTVAPTQALPPVLGNNAQGALQQVEVGGQTFRVAATEVVQDWQFSDEPGVASWITGTVFNYIVGLPYNTANAALFTGLKTNDPVRLTVATGDVLQFRLTAVRRIATTDTRVLAQDHPGVTLLLLGEPAADRMAALGDYAPQAAAP